MWEQVGAYLVITLLSIIGGGFLYLYKVFHSLKAGLQALLRKSMLDEYRYYNELGYMPTEYKQSFATLWTNYHNLGMNGVMDSVKDKVLALPDKPPKEGE